MRFTEFLGRRRKQAESESAAEPEQAATTEQAAEPEQTIEPRMATDLGYALVAYWRSGEWWGSDHLSGWLIKHGHISEARFCLEEVLRTGRVPEAIAKQLRGRQRALERYDEPVSIPEQTTTNGQKPLPAA